MPLNQKKTGPPGMATERPPLVIDEPGLNFCSPKIRHSFKNRPSNQKNRVELGGRRSSTLKNIVTPQKN